MECRISTPVVATLSRSASSNTIKIDNHVAVHFENLLAALQNTNNSIWCSPVDSLVQTCLFLNELKLQVCEIYAVQWHSEEKLYKSLCEFYFPAASPKPYSHIDFRLCRPFFGLDSKKLQHMYIRRLSVNYVTDAKEPLSGYLPCSLWTASNYTILRLVCDYFSIEKSFSRIIKESLKWN